MWSQETTSFRKDRRAVNLMRTLAVAAATFSLLLAVITVGCDRFEKWTVINKTASPIRIKIASAKGEPSQPVSVAYITAGVYRAYETRRFGELPPEKADARLLTIVRAYEFVPGKGNLIGWREPDGSTIMGGQGQLVFCMIYTGEELRATSRVIIVTRNVVDGNRLDDPSRPCPELPSES